ncbi:shikimate dehydrogenase family protein [Pontibacter harenae]|uniref:shikimate dehydrogenase family protein n=1 Tax=Pontibacter harenae TaxID=2894083 RepID=UPI001E4DAE3F|nr:shikimate dehydrogenase [Pontibacter harenae]MCC9168183.1 shikimate dehydrogenase [Pontibacter harenae]
MRTFGLIGKKLGHSFSKRYFSEKFQREGITDAHYELYELPGIDELPVLLAKEPTLVGLNVTVPYKEVVIPFLDKLSDAAAQIGAVNTIKIENGTTTGYNTDYIGFRNSLEDFYPEQERNKALVLGTGGAAKAVLAVLKSLGVPYTSVSRVANSEAIAYTDVSPATLKEYNLIINTTPLGMYPEVETLPALPYESLSAGHYLYDLVYNPEQTAFLQQGQKAGAKTSSGLAMLHGQAEAAWEIWNNTAG